MADLPINRLHPRAEQLLTDANQLNLFPDPIKLTADNGNHVARGSSPNENKPRVIRHALLTLRKAFTLTSIPTALEAAFYLALMAIIAIALTIIEAEVLLIVEYLL